MGSRLPISILMSPSLGVLELLGHPLAVQGRKNPPIALPVTLWWKLFSPSWEPLIANFGELPHSVMNCRNVCQCRRRNENVITIPKKLVGFLVPSPLLWLTWTVLCIKIMPWKEDGNSEFAVFLQASLQLWFLKPTEAYAL